MADTQALAAQVSRALQQRDRAGFVTAATALIDARAPMTRGWKALTQPLLDWGELSLARRSIDLYAAAMKDTPAAQFDRALVYTRAGRPAEALAMLERIDRGVPDRAGHAYLRGTIALNMGEREVARAALIEASAARPSSGQIYHTLSTTGSIGEDAEAAERILAAESAMTSAPVADQGPYLYALGKTLDDLGETDRAFAAFAAGAASIAAARPHDGERDRRVAETATRGWTADALTAAHRPGTERPIIVTGLPRSGSTLVEHILASHSAVADGAELARFALVVAEVGGRSRADLDAWRRTGSVDDLSRLYLHLLAERFGPHGRVVDKTLEASRYLGTLAAVMPDAPILWMRRDPLDNAWSCFSTYFIEGVAWSYWQEAIAAHFRLEDELLARWRDVLGDRLMVVDYERLVSDKEAEIPRLLAHCGLAMEPQVLTPERTERLVTTASVTQVRSPINRSAIAKGQRYRRHLQPFLDAYQPT